MMVGGHQRDINGPKRSAHLALLLSHVEGFEIDATPVVI